MQQKKYTVADLALRTELPESRVKAALDRLRYSDELLCGTAEEYDVLMTAREESPEDDYLRKERACEIKEALSSLEILDRKIFIDRFGLDENSKPGRSWKNPGMSYKAIASKYNISIEQVKESLRESKKKLENSPLLKPYDYRKKSDR